MAKLFRLFFRFKGTNPWLVIGCLVIASLAQGVGMASLVPLVSLVTGEGVDGSSPITQMVSEVLGSVSLEISLEALLGFILAMVLLKSALSIVAMTYVGYATAEVASHLRQRLIEVLLRARWGFFTRKPMGHIVAAVGMESAFSGNLFGNLARLVAHTVQAAVYVVVAFAVSWKLAAAGSLIGAVILVSLQIFVKIAHRAGHKNIRKSRELVTDLSDAVAGLKPLKAMNRQERFQTLFAKKINQIRKAARREAASRQLLKQLQEPILVIFLLTGFYFLSQVVGMPIGEVLVMGLVIDRFVKTIGRVQTQLQDARIAEAAFFSVDSMISEAKREEERHTGTKPASFETGGQFQGVSFAYGEKQVLQRFSFEFAANQLTLLIGPSGGGKTTITDLLIGLYQPDSGRVLIDDIDLRELDIASWRSLIGYVPQELILLHDSIHVNVTLGDPNLSADDVEQALRLAGAWDFISNLPEGTMTVVGEKGSKLSGGQRQRIALARALVKKPKLLILDEVTSALDHESELAICRNIQELGGKVTILAVSHRPAWLQIAQNTITVTPLDSVTLESAAAE